MLFRILRERKRREFDPARAAVDQALSAGAGGGGELATDRLGQMKLLVDTLDQLAERLLADEAQARQMLAFLTAGRSGT